jgi:PAS domain S-box-containing protein
MKHSDLLLELFNHSQDVLYCYNLDERKYEFLSQSSLEVFGYPADYLETLKPEEALQFIHTDDISILVEALNKVVETGYAEVEYRQKVKGSYRWMCNKMNSLRYNGIFYSIGAIRDITEQKNKEEELKALNLLASRRLAEIENLYETLPVGLALFDRDLKFVRINKMLAEITGISISDHIGNSIKDLLPDIYDFSREVANKIIETGEPWLGIELAGTTPAKPGVLRSWEENWMPVKDSKGEILGFSVLVIETTEKKKAQERLLKVKQALQRSQKRLKLILSHNKVGLWERDLETGKITFDRRMNEIYGIEGRRKFLTYSDLLTFIYNEDLPFFENTINKSLESGQPIDLIYRLLKNKNITYVSSRANVIRDRDNKPVKLIGVATDVTEMQKKVEKMISDMNLELLRSNTDLQQFAYIASHDLQEPLRMVSSFTQLLQRKYANKLDKEALEYIQYAVDGSKRMYEMINGLLTFSRVHTKASMFSKVDMNYVVECAIQNLFQKIDESKAKIMVSHLPVIKGDATQLIHVIQNLVDNAIKFSDDIPRIEISYTEDFEKFIFSVKDEGEGIDKKYFDRIFRMFQRLQSSEKYPGVGIGLAVCKRVIERHKGDIWLESEEGKGTKFSFSIPK